MKQQFLHFLPAVIWFILIGILLILPGKDIPKADFLETIYFDKWVHTGLFAVLVFLFSYPLRNTFFYKSSFYFLIIIMAILYGVAMEYVQKYFTTDRSFDTHDMLADAAGACIGYLLFRFVTIKVSQKNKPL